MLLPMGCRLWDVFFLTVLYLLCNQLCWSLVSSHAYHTLEQSGPVIWNFAPSSSQRVLRVTSFTICVSSFARLSFLGMRAYLCARDAGRCKASFLSRKKKRIFDAFL
ncbi:hypothetical protein B0J12DRAFT_96533 [Macrophomina phaseolina]|uniref:Secreted protein n=1 Tax=Macrophomina phaseolina TaxID=35725 RepID=A0ABQ8GA77_9PEZI|nr:hypothetical protein B0J12DRAFT_96533 [Macrophomina phaseolina]